MSYLQRNDFRKQKTMQRTTQEHIMKYDVLYQFEVALFMGLLLCSLWVPFLSKQFAYYKPLLCHIWPFQATYGRPFRCHLYYGARKSEESLRFPTRMNTSPRQKTPLFFLERVLWHVRTWPARVLTFLIYAFLFLFLEGGHSLMTSLCWQREGGR